MEGLVITVESKGISSGIALRLLSHPRLHVSSAKDHTGRDCPLRFRPQGSDSQDNPDRRCPGVPILITPEEPKVLITVRGQ